jgi:hypothetical protein
MGNENLMGRQLGKGTAWRHSDAMGKERGLELAFFRPWRKREMGWELLTLRSQKKGKELKPLRYGNWHTSEPGEGNGGNWHLSDPLERGSGNWHPNTLKKR